MNESAQEPWVPLSVKIKRMHLDAILPAYQTALSSGADVFAYLPMAPVRLAAGEAVTIPLGFAIEVPEGYEAQIRSRSGLAARNHVAILNGIGTIDADYRGEVHAILVNHHLSRDFTIRDGDRIAQLVIAPVERVAFVEVNSISQTGRGVGGFGSTGR